MDKIFYTLLGDKMKVKIFDMEDEKDLENEVNDFIDTMDGEIIDIKYQVSVGLFILNRELGSFLFLCYYYNEVV